jgi:hypothetical protein
MRLRRTHRELNLAPQDLCDAVRKQILAVDWSLDQYNRTERVLYTGKVAEMPYAITEFHVMSQQDPLAQATQLLVDWIGTQDGLERFEPVRAEIATLNPGVRLHVHRDRCWFHANARRMHVPLITNDRCWHHGSLMRQQTSIHTEFYRMTADRLYELNNIDPHSAGNEGTQGRTHLIVDFMPRGFLSQRQAEGINPKAQVDNGVVAEWIPAHVLGPDARQTSDPKYILSS